MYFSGVVLTLPEYRLSFQLKIYEAPSKNDLQCAEALLSIHKWLNENARNILDESDAILQPKYQLIYTLGEQLSLDGGAQRWTVIQELLKRLPQHLYKLWQVVGDEKMEFDKDYAKHGRIAGYASMDFRSDVFTPCRIFDDKVYNQLKSKLIDDIVDGTLSFSLGLTHQKKPTLRLLLDEGNVSTNEYNDLLTDVSPAQQNILLILSGFLRFNILQLVLEKRWRVNYGVNENGQRKMAIPFKAKDVAGRFDALSMECCSTEHFRFSFIAEMTEFGHPDVAICLTQLSYYYSGWFRILIAPGAVPSEILLQSHCGYVSTFQVSTKRNSTKYSKYWKVNRIPLKFTRPGYVPFRVGWLTTAFNFTPVST